MALRQDLPHGECDASLPGGYRISNVATSVRTRLLNVAKTQGSDFNISGELAKVQCKTQIDIGFGDAVTPSPIDAVYPVLLSDLPAPRLRTYPVYTVVAEKLQAIVLLGMTDSRLKDYFDLSVLLEREALDIDLLARAIKATFERRGMTVPTVLPIELTNEFAQDASRQSLWQTFLKKNEIITEPLTAIVDRLSKAMEPALNRATQ